LIHRKSKLEIGITTQASLELKGHNFLFLDVFLNISHLDRLPTAKRSEMEPFVYLRVDLPKRKTTKS
jgi:hypothetical protein